MGRKERPGFVMGFISFTYKYMIVWHTDLGGKISACHMPHTVARSAPVLLRNPNEPVQQNVARIVLYASILSAVL
ncbi:uncharacterized protein YALI1_B05730g [Yarrowia lipolytica]|uniref:Uncharacterized protein n=1 Tax=Yarrowia lipolytica TaxID=4952 RepID=A0A1D8N6D4_YARLL|nr:hypothetical protein YALI1_B05730g [Yarrowia lipolytica]